MGSQATQGPQQQQEGHTGAPGCTAASAAAAAAGVGSSAHGAPGAGNTATAQQQLPPLDMRTMVLLAKDYQNICAAGGSEGAAIESLRTAVNTLVGREALQSAAAARQLLSRRVAQMLTWLGDNPGPEHAEERERMLAQPFKLASRSKQQHPPGQHPPGQHPAVQPYPHLRCLLEQACPPSEAAELVEGAWRPRALAVAMTAALTGSTQLSIGAALDVEELAQAQGYPKLAAAEVLGWADTTLAHFERAAVCVKLLRARRAVAQAAPAERARLLAGALEMHPVTSRQLRSALARQAAAAQAAAAALEHQEQQHQAALAQQQQQHWAELAEAGQRGEAAAAEWQQHHQAELAEHQQQHEAALEELERKHAAQREKAEAEAQEQLLACRAELCRALEQWEEMAQEARVHAAEAAAIRSACLQLAAANNELRGRLAATTGQLAEAERKAHQLAVDCQFLVDKLQAAGHNKCGSDRRSRHPEASEEVRTLWTNWARNDKKRADRLKHKTAGGCT